MAVLWGRRSCQRAVGFDSTRRSTSSKAMAGLKYRHLFFKARLQHADGKRRGAWAGLKVLKDVFRRELSTAIVESALAFGVSKRYRKKSSLLALKQ